LEFYRDYIGGAPREMGVLAAFQIAPPLPFILVADHGKTLCAMLACWSGPLEPGEKELEAIRTAAPTVAETVGPMPYPALNAAFDPPLPSGLYHYWKASFASELTDGPIEAHLRHGPRVPVVHSTMHIYPINGACNRVRPDATAFAYREAKFATVIAGIWPDAAGTETNVGWVKDYYHALQPDSASGGSVNFVADDDQGRVEDNYRDNYGRLVSIKGKYDPGNLFHPN
jgi:hypothetical protein